MIAETITTESAIKTNINKLIQVALYARQIVKKVDVYLEWNTALTTIDYLGENKLSMERYAIHNGQRKLFNALLLFMTEFHDQSSDVVYLGAYPGFNIQIVARCFPNHKFYLYDLKPIEMNLPNVITIKERVTTETRFRVKEGECILFSDIRSDEGMDKEKSVENDQKLQLQIVDLLKPKAFCLKFRIPFYEDKGIKKTADDKGVKKTVDYQYTTGTICIQPYAPQQTTEVRLMSQFTIDKKTYSLREHENKMFYINTVLREWQPCEVIPGVIGGDDCFDCALEENICTKYIERYGHTVQSLIDDIRLRVGTIGLLDVVSFRNYISLFHPTLSISRNEHKSERINPYLSIKEVDILDIFANIYHEWVGFEETVTAKDIKAWFTNRNNNEALLLRSLTHSSVNSVENYEQLEFVGDGILSGETRFYLLNRYSASGVHDYSTLYNYLASKEFRSEEIEKKLNLTKYLDIEHHGLITDKVKDDLVEAFFGMTRILFDRNIGRGFGSRVITNIVSKLLDTVDMQLMIDKAMSKKTLLKEELERLYPSSDFSKMFHSSKEGNVVKVVIKTGDNVILYNTPQVDINQTKAETIASDIALKALTMGNSKAKIKELRIYRRNTPLVIPKENPQNKCIKCMLRSTDV